MTKLKMNEIEDYINLENGKTDLPRNARSIFRFNIAETCQEILDKLEADSKKFMKQERFMDNNGEVSFSNKEPVNPWDYKKCENGDIYLWDLDFPCAAIVHPKPDEQAMTIETAGGFIYEICDFVDENFENPSGATVYFDGPINGMMQQTLLPRMTYVPFTLEGRFYDPDTNKSLTPYLKMDDFGYYRELKNKKIISDNYSYDRPGNQQDVYGWQVNKLFNNEIPFLPKADIAKNLQERNLLVGQKNYGKTAQDLSYNKMNVEESLKRLRKLIAGRNDGLSGVVEADQRAENIIKAQILSAKTKASAGK